MPVSVSQERRLRFAHCSNCGLPKENELKCKCGTETYIGLWDREQTGCIELGFSEYGIGVYATEDIPAWTLIESCPAYLFQKDDFAKMANLPMALTPNRQDNTIANHMFFPWIDEKTRVLAVGYAMLYNHAWEPLALYWYRMDAQTGRYFLDYFTIHDVKAGQEITITYGDETWFYPFKNPNTSVVQGTLGHSFARLRHGKNLKK